MVSSAPIAPISSTKTESVKLVTRQTAPEELSSAERETMEATREPEIMLFSKMAQYVSEIAPKATTFINPVAEHAGAAVASVNTPPSLFTTTSEGRLVAQAGNTHASELSMALASGITPSSESENGSNQEHQESGRNVYVSANKTKDDRHLEELYRSDINDVFSVC